MRKFVTVVALFLGVSLSLGGVSSAAAGEVRTTSGVTEAATARSAELFALVTPGETTRTASAASIATNNPNSCPGRVEKVLLTLGAAAITLVLATHPEVDVFVVVGYAVSRSAMKYVASVLAGGAAVSDLATYVCSVLLSSAYGNVAYMDTSGVSYA
ncbi:hypothetical protein [Amycolatopsis sp. NPDC004378]